MFFDGIAATLEFLIMRHISCSIVTAGLDIRANRFTAAPESSKVLSLSQQEEQ